MEENRTSNRHPVHLDVTLSYQDNTTEQHMSNLSLGGALITVPDRLPMGARVQLSFEVPGSGTSITVGAVIRWSTNDSTGVQFDGLRAREVWSLNKYFKTFE